MSFTDAPVQAHLLEDNDEDNGDEQSALPVGPSPLYQVGRGAIRLDSIVHLFRFIVQICTLLTHCLCIPCSSCAGSFARSVARTVARARAHLGAARQCRHAALVLSLGPIRARLGGRVLVPRSVGSTNLGRRHSLESLLFLLFLVIWRRHAFCADGLDGRIARAT
jgi:hypothetical protein